MAFGKFDGFTFSHAAQIDTPALTPEQVKDDFDSRGDELQTYLDTLIDALNAATAAGNLGAAEVAGLTGATIQALIESLKSYLDTNFYTDDETDAGFATKQELHDAVLGAIPDDSLTAAKIKADAVTDAKIGNRTIDQSVAPAGPNTASQLLTLLDNLANRLKTVSGETNWSDTPGKDLKTLASNVSAHLADYAHHYKKDAGSSDAYVVALDPAITSYTEGMTLDIFCKTANDGAATLDAGGGAKDLRKYYNDALETGDIEAGAIITVKWDSANDWWQVTSGIKVTVVDASETVKGIVELATAAEVTAGTSTTTAVTPAGAKVELDKKALIYASSYTGNGSTSNRTITVGFTPKFVYVMGDKTGTGSGGGFGLTNSNNYGFGMKNDANITFNNQPGCGFPVITTNGFIVKLINSGDNYGLNYNGTTYYYVAIG